jgi:2-polyprenyl-3-methyl-5-hydroxy-6-metoxy-1,4-benzoquinol methylase
MKDTQIIDSWYKNAEPWTIAVREKQIESRLLVTDRAIVETILDVAPQSVLDLGCGEGWLVRKLAQAGIHAIGVDAIPALVEKARESGGGDFFVATYEEIAGGKLNLTVDAIACNFSLFGEESVAELLGAIPTLLNRQGVLIIQTLHPLVSCRDLPYRDGWREGSWSGFSTDFVDPPPWYFRTLSSWLDLFSRHGWRLKGIKEPIHPKTLKPASLIIIGEGDGC